MDKKVLLRPKPVDSGLPFIGCRLNNKIHTWHRYKNKTENLIKATKGKSSATQSEHPTIRPSQNLQKYS